MSVDFHRAYGIHSNIPSCCVEFFCAQIEAGVEHIAKVQWEAFGFRWPEDTYLLFRYHPSYVLCTEHMKEFVGGRRDFPPLHKCNKKSPECIPFYEQKEQI